MGEWALAAFERLKDREGAAHAENQRLALERQQVLDTAPDIWKTLFDELSGEVAHFDKMRPGLMQMKYDQSHAPSLTVKLNARTLAVEFNSQIPRISYRISESQGPTERPIEVVKGEYAFKVISQEVWLYSRETSQIAVPAVVNRLLGNLG